MYSMLTSLYYYAKNNNNKPLLETQVAIQNWLLSPNNWAEHLFMNIMLQKWWQLDAQDDFSAEKINSHGVKVHKKAIIFNQENLPEKNVETEYIPFLKYRYWKFKYCSWNEEVTSNKPEVSNLPSNVV